MNNLAMIHHVEWNFFDCFRGIESTGDTTAFETDFFQYFITGIRHPWFNAIVRFDPDRVETSQLVRVMNDFRDRGVPASIFLTPSNRKVYLENLLDENRCGMIEELTGMCRRLSPETDRGITSLDPLVIEKVSSEAAMREWLDVLAGWWNIPQGDMDKVIRFYGNPEEPGHSAWQYFLGRIDGRPAATSALFTGSDSAGIYYVGTTPALRTRGAGSAMTRFCLESAAAQGFEYAVLQATPMAVNLYRRLGFLSCCTFSRYEI